MFSRTGHTAFSLVKGGSDISTPAMNAAAAAGLIFTKDRQSLMVEDLQCKMMFDDRRHVAEKPSIEDDHWPEGPC